MVLSSARSETRRIYVAVGDSLSAGLQPDAEGNDRPTDQGYVHQLATALRPRTGSLSIEHYGGGGTTNTLIDGSPKQSMDTPALVQAERFLRGHRGQVALVSLNIGDNDIGGCISPSGIDRRCTADQLTDVAHNLPLIVRRLQQAAGTGVPLVGLVDYDQFWAYWLRGGRAREVALESPDVISDLNAEALDVYRRTGAIGANAAHRFAIHADTPLVPLRGHGRVPRAVARVCGLTWACSQPPIGFDDHANARGYRLLSQSMYAALEAAGKLPGDRTGSGGAGP